MEEVQLKIFDIKDKIGDGDYNELCMMLKAVYEKKRREGSYIKWYRLYYLKQVKEYDFDDQILNLNLQYSSIIAYSKDRDLDLDDIGKPFSTNVEDTSIYFMEFDEPQYLLASLQNGTHEIHYHEKILLKYELINT